jgi:carbonic anhydrase
LFVIRNAGNVAASDVLASIDYATTYLHAPLVVVMGHEKCGAVAAALGPKAARAGEGIDLQSLLDMIDPALEASHVRGTDAQAVDAGVEANVRWTVARLREDGANGTLRGARDVMFVGAVYDLESGRVRFLDSE